MVKWEREDIEGTELDVLQGPFQLKYTLILSGGKLPTLTIPRTDFKKIYKKKQTKKKQTAFKSVAG